ncbi:hypothetical protein STRDD11_00983 [Streptococcus sp. DD11]|nr:hypothetical protein STRDD11_00983 [Streptococcus sp. DD11]
MPESQNLNYNAGAPRKSDKKRQTKKTNRFEKRSLSTV